MERLRNEHFVQETDSNVKRHITDSHFRITERNVTKDYHLECESGGYSESILLRIFQYGVSHASVDTAGAHDRLTIRMPEAGLLVLRDKGNPPQKMLPEFDRDEVARQDFTEIYCDIIERVRDVDENDLSIRSKGVIIKQMESVIKRLAYRRRNIKGKVDDIMGGKVVKMEWLEKFDAAVAEGRAEGRVEGRAEGEAEREQLENEKSKLEKRIKQLEEQLKKAKVAAL